MTAPIRLAVVDDSAFVRKALARVFDQSGDVRVVGMASSGEELLDRIEEWNPGAVTLDLSMPGMGGLATLDRLMVLRRQLRVIILSSHSAADAPLTIEALNRGAADFIDKEEISLVDFESIRSVILEKLRAITHVEAQEPAIHTTLPIADELTMESGQLVAELVTIGASTGGPPAIESILAQLPAELSVPIVVAQHMPAGFTAAFAQRLNGKLPFPVREASHGGVVETGTVYIAPGGSHLRLRYEGAKLTAVLSRYPEVIHRPSIDLLFQSVAALPFRTLGVLLTGMGDDGAKGLLELARSGAHTIGQDERTSIVYGMPRRAMELGAVREQLPLEEIARRISGLIGVSEGQA
jgi:two-component system, chemotaxis family, protein-glutamate methylesterase/glutaminase